MPTATWNGVVLAQSDATVVVEGNHYFPPDSLRREHFRDSPQESYCGWKGAAKYFDIVVGEEVNSAAAWYYPEPKQAAESIRDHVAFWKGVEVSGESASPQPSIQEGQCRVDDRN